MATAPGPRFVGVEGRDHLIPAGSREERGTWFGGGPRLSGPRAIAFSPAQIAATMAESAPFVANLDMANLRLGDGE